MSPLSVQHCSRVDGYNPTVYLFFPSLAICTECKLTASFPGRSLCKNASAARFPTLFSTPSFARNKLGDCNYCKSRDLVCSARNWTFLGSTGTLPDKHTLDEAVAYEQWMEDHAVDTEFTQQLVKRKRASVGGTQSKKRTNPRVSSPRSLPTQSASSHRTPSPQLPPTPDSRPTVTPAQPSSAASSLGPSNHDNERRNNPPNVVNGPGFSSSYHPTPATGNRLFPVGTIPATNSIPGTSVTPSPIPPAASSSVINLGNTANETSAPLLGSSQNPLSISLPTPSSLPGSSLNATPSSLPSSSLNALGITLPTPRHPEEVMAAHNLLWTEYQLQQTRLAAIPSLESHITQLSASQASQASLSALEEELSSLRSTHTSVEGELQLAQVELTVLRAGQRARDERIAALERDVTGAEQRAEAMKQRMQQRAAEMERRARAGEAAAQHAQFADERTLVVQQTLGRAEARIRALEADVALSKVQAENARVELVAARAETAQAREESSVAKAEAERLRELIRAEEEPEDGEISDDPIALLLVRRKLAQTQKRLAAEQKEKQALTAELARVRAELERATCPDIEFEW